MPLEHSLATEMLIPHLRYEREAAAARVRTLRLARAAAASGLARDRRRSRPRQEPARVGRLLQALARRVGRRPRTERTGVSIGTGDPRSAVSDGRLTGKPAACAARP